MRLLRHTFVLAVTAAVTWWVLFQAPAPGLVLAEASAEMPPLRAQLQPAAETLTTEPQPPEPQPEPAPESAAATPPAQPAPGEVEPVQADPVQAEPAPAEPEPLAAAELGSLSGTEDAERREAQETPEPAPQPERPTTDELATDVDLLRQAEDELSGVDVALGFATTLISEPEQQLQIARAFGEEILLVPKAALGSDSDAASFRLRPGVSNRKETLLGLPDLQNARQHRDLFAYDPGRLPEEIRELRRSVIRRDEVFLFAAMIPASEWAVVIGRRREAVEAAGVSESEVERYVLRYVPVTGDKFDFFVEELHLADGTKLRHPFR